MANCLRYNYFLDCNGIDNVTSRLWKFSALISIMANYLRYNYIWDCNGIDNVTSRLWKFSDFCSRHTVGVVGDDIMFHILVLDSRLNIMGNRIIYFIVLCFMQVLLILTQQFYIMIYMKYGNGRTNRGIAQCSNSPTETYLPTHIIFTERYKPFRMAMVLNCGLLLLANLGMSQRQCNSKPGANISVI